MCSNPSNRGATFTLRCSPNSQEYSNCFGWKIQDGEWSQQSLYAKLVKSKQINAETWQLIFSTQVDSLLYLRMKKFEL